MTLRRMLSDGVASLFGRGASLTDFRGRAEPSGTVGGEPERTSDGATGTWVPKTKNGGTNTFFPDAMTAADVQAAIRHAYADALRNGKTGSDGRFEGDSGSGFVIVGFVREGAIKTAYPVM